MLARITWLLVVASLAGALLATLGFVVATAPVRIPYWGEAEVLFEASRLRAHLPLYVDPLIGAFDQGEPPSRFYVTYPPLWTAAVSLVPSSAATIAARVACSLAWFGALAGIAWTARPDVRREAAAAAAFVGGIWVLANFASIGRPDSIACAIAAFTLVRAMRRGRLDLVCVAALVVVPWVKPTIIGLPVGALVGGCFVDRKDGLRKLGAAVLLAAASAAVAHLATGGALFAHVVRSNAQPLSWAVWLEQVGGRLPFFGPLFAWAAWRGWRDRARPGPRIGLAALAASFVWTLFALAKTGSASNYWMEPSIAAVALVAQSAPDGVRIGGRNLVHAALALVAVLWTDVASIRGAIEHAVRMRADGELVSSVRARVGLPSDAVVASDEAGIELAANGRILTPTYQMVHLVRRGTYPPEPWIAQLTAPRTRAFVEHTGQLRLAPVLQRALEEHYEVIVDEGGFRIWKRR